MAKKKLSVAINAFTDELKIQQKEDLVLGMVFAIFAPMNHNFEHMTPDNFDEYYPDTSDGTAIPADKGSILPAYELSESFAVVSVDF